MVGRNVSFLFLLLFCYSFVGCWFFDRNNKPVVTRDPRRSPIRVSFGVLLFWFWFWLVVDWSHDRTQGQAYM